MPVRSGDTSGTNIVLTCSPQLYCFFEEKSEYFDLVSLHGDQCKCTVSRWASPRQYTADPMLLPSGNPFKCHEEVLSFQPMILPKRFDISPPDWGMLRRSRCVQIFLQTVDNFSPESGCSEGLLKYAYIFFLNRKNSCIWRSEIDISFLSTTYKQIYQPRPQERPTIRYSGVYTEVNRWIVGVVRVSVQSERHQMTRSPNETGPNEGLLL